MTSSSEQSYNSNVIPKDLRPVNLAPASNRTTALSSLEHQLPAPMSGAGVSPRGGGLGSGFGPSTNHGDIGNSPTERVVYYPTVYSQGVEVGGGDGVSRMSGVNPGYAWYPRPPQVAAVVGSNGVVAPVVAVVGTSGVITPVNPVYRYNEVSGFGRGGGGPSVGNVSNIGGNGNMSVDQLRAVNRRGIVGGNLGNATNGNGNMGMDQLREEFVNRDGSSPERNGNVGVDQVKEDFVNRGGGIGGNGNNEVAGFGRGGGNSVGNVGNSGNVGFDHVRDEVLVNRVGRVGGNVGTIGYMNTGGNQMKAEVPGFVNQGGSPPGSNLSNMDGNGNGNLDVDKLREEFVDRAGGTVGNVGIIGYRNWNTGGDQLREESLGYFNRGGNVGNMNIDQLRPVNRGGAVGGNVGNFGNATNSNVNLRMDQLREDVPGFVSRGGVGGVSVSGRNMGGDQFREDVSGVVNRGGSPPDSVGNIGGNAQSNTGNVGGNQLRGGIPGLVNRGGGAGDRGIVGNNENWNIGGDQLREEGSGFVNRSGSPGSDTGNVVGSENMGVDQLRDEVSGFVSQVGGNCGNVSIISDNGNRNMGSDQLREESLGFANQGGKPPGSNIVNMGGNGNVVVDKLREEASRYMNRTSDAGDTLGNIRNNGYWNMVGDQLREESLGFVNRVGGNIDNMAVDNLGGEVMGFANRDAGAESNIVSMDGTGNVGVDQLREEGSGMSLSSEEQSMATIGKRVKILCSYGGKILPRPSDGMLRYVGGQTRIITVKHDISFHGLVQKMIHMYGQPVIIKYQLPDEDLDALVSVSNAEDLENMMEEYVKLVEASPDGSAKIRVFLFSASELDPSDLLQFGDVLDSGKKYLDAVNGISDGVSLGVVRKDSLASATSTQNSDALVSGGGGVDNIGGVPTPPVVGEVPLNCMYVPTHTNMHVESPTIASEPPQSSPFSRNEPVLEIPIERVAPSIMQQQTPLDIKVQQPPVMSYPSQMNYMPGYVDPHKEVLRPVDYTQLSPQVGYRNPQFFTMGGQVYQQIGHHQQQLRDDVVAPQQSVLGHPQQFQDNLSVSQQYIPAVRVSPQQSQISIDLYNFADNPYGGRHVQLQGDHVYRTYQRRPPVPQTSAPVQVGGGPGWRQVTSDDHLVYSDGFFSHQQGGNYERLPQLDDCFMCQKALPHAHSDTVVQDFRQNNVSPNSDMNPVYRSLCLDNASFKNPPLSRLVVNGTSRKGIMDQGSGAGSGIAAPQQVRVRLPPDSELQSDTPKSTNSDYSKNMPAQSAMVTPSDSNPQLSVYNNPQTHQEVPLQQPLEQFAYQQVGTNILPVRIIPLQVSESVDQESSKEYASNHPGFHQDKDMSESSHLSEHLRPIEQVQYRPSNAEFQHPTSDKVWHDRPALAADLAFASDKYSLTSDREGKDTLGRVCDTENGGPIVDSLLNLDEKVGDREFIASNSLFSQQDPWTLQHDMHLVPPPIESDRNKGSAEERVKEELQAVAEGVAALVLQKSLPSDSSAPSMKEDVSEASQSREAGDNSALPLALKTNSPERLGPVLPAKEGIGRLQIIKNSDLEELWELGSGTFGTVYHGKWRGSDVAIKRINDRCFAGKPSEQDQMRDDFWNEAIKLADLHHPNVVAFYGVVLDGPGGSVATVTEYMVNGSLRQAIQRNERAIDKRKRLVIAMDVACGMEYLHGRNIVHFDLKSDNLLVNLRDPHRPICKVGDLGLSKVKCQTLISGGVRGTLPWMAPELLNGSSSKVSEKVDVFSFGIVMWELLTGEEPYADLHYGAIIGGIVNNTLRPPVPESCDGEWKSLMERCWAAEPNKRPCFTEIADCLRSIAASMPPRGQGSPPQQQQQQTQQPRQQQQLLQSQQQ